jgi:hypothetical protein
MIRRLLRRDIPVPLALLWACLLCYGALIPWLGLYADDWPFVYAGSLGGLRGVVEFISWVRPVAAWIFGAETALVGTHFWAYHALLLLLRWLDALLLWQVLRLAWPQPALGDPALWAALLFCVYPAFKQAPLALEYGPHFIALGLLFLSLWASLLLLSRLALSRRSRLLLWVVAWAGSFQVFIIEYFAGLEILRPLLAWVVLRRGLGARNAAGRALLHWLPFLPVLAGFLVWRVFGLGFPSYQPELVSGLASSPLAELAGLASTIPSDLWTAGAAAWAQPFTLIPAGKTRLAWGAITAVALITFAAFLLRRQRPPLPPAEMASLPGSRSWPAAALAIGLLSMFFSGWPFWITHIPLELNFPWDRPSLAFMTGACILAAGALGLLASLRSLRALPPIALAVLLAGSAGLHFQNANLYRKEGALLNGFFWQLSWRAPALSRGTAVILDQTPFNYHSDKFLVPLLNWTYAPDSTSLAVPYWLFDFYKLEEKGAFRSHSAPLEARYGTLSFSGSAQQALFVIYNPPACLYVLSPGADRLLPLPGAVKEALQASSSPWIDASPARPAHPPRFLGDEPTRGWCYYFEKAELALQSGDAATAARLGDEAFAAGLAPVNTAEYLPFVDAYAQTARWEDAAHLTDLAVQNDFTRRAACAAWERLASQGFAAQSRPLLVRLGCGD